MLTLAVLFGGLVGVALGLTGGGGGVLAVPLLVYGLAVAPREAVGISLSAVGGTALLGVAPRLWLGEIDWTTGLLFAAAGMIGAPVGTRLATWFSEQLLLILFALLMTLIAWQMWKKTSPSASSTTRRDTKPDSIVGTWQCQRDDNGKVSLSLKCLAILAGMGFSTGILSGLFGVGGGFVIVPALVLLSGMAMKQAVPTSMLVIFLISASGVFSYWASGRSLSWDITAFFLLGGSLGIYLGRRWADHCDGPTLQKIFAAAVVLVALFVMTKSMVS